MGPKEEQNPARQTGPVTPLITPCIASRKIGLQMLFPKGWSCPTLLALLVTVHMDSLLTNISLQPAAFLCRLLASLNSWGLHSSFTFTALYIVCSGSACRDPGLAMFCLASQVFLWNLSGSHNNPLTLASCIPVNTVLHGRPQSLLSAGAILGTPGVKAAAASEWLCNSAWWNKFLAPHVGAVDPHDLFSKEFSLLYPGSCSECGLANSWAALRTLSTVWGEST